MSIVLYAKRGCPFVQRTKSALHLKGIGFEERIIDTQNKPEAFLRLTPFGRVPVLIDGETIVYESLVINEYIEDRFDAPRLLPGNARDRARARFISSYDDTSLVPAFYDLVHAQQADTAAQALRLLRERLARLDDLMDRAAPFMTGKHISLGDITVYPHLQRYYLLERYRKAPPLSPRLSQWLATMAQIPAIQQASPSWEVIEEDLAPYLQGNRVHKTVA